MWKFVVGFGVGVYVGTYYECKPMISKITKMAQENTPSQKEDNKTK